MNTSLFIKLSNEELINKQELKNIELQIDKPISVHWDLRTLLYIGIVLKYNYRILPAEIEMLIAGSILIAVSYIFIKYLIKPKYGYTSENIYHSGKRL